MTSYKVPSEQVDTVRIDGLPRLVNDERAAGVQHVLYLEGSKVRSMLATDWPPPLPSDPTPQEIAAAIAARRAAEQQERANITAIRARIIAIMQPIVGQSIDTPLTAAQMQAMLRLLARQAGGIRPDGTWAPLSEWAKE